MPVRSGSEARNCSRKEVLRANIGRATRLKGVEEAGAACAVVYAAGRAQACLVNATSVIVNSSQVCLLEAIDPQREAAIVCPGGGRCAPVQFERVRRITERDPVCRSPCLGVIHQKRSQLITCRLEAQFHLEDLRGATESLEDQVRVSNNHGNRVGIEIEAGSIT